MNTEFFKHLDLWIGIFADFFTITASVIAIYVFFANKNKISLAINFILNYSKRVTLTELKHKVEKLNDFNARDEKHKEEIINILSEIEGQIIGNKSIKEELSSQLSKIRRYILNPSILTEPKKRSLVSELRECLVNVDISNYHETVKSKKNG